jgi:serine/threonine protein kinase
MSESKLERFGKYLILDHLVDGGMAKICRARYLGEQSNKIVAIKMVQPQFSNDPSFVRMFQDELAVTFGLQHPNIAQVYDYGKVHNQLYTALEYVDGANLKQYLDRLKEKQVVFPVEISVYIISQVCQALHYAHTFTDKLTGKPLSIVHRDISPHNIMVTYDGAVKVIDFGIAKANTNSEATQAGTIKGKLSYLSPEVLEGLELDHRNDQFAVGITIWEMLCGKKLFSANNDLGVLKLIQACKIQPPSQINPMVPKELEAIVMKALSKDRELRFEDMDKLNRALIKFLYSQYPDFNQSDLGYFAKELFKEEIAKDREKFVAYGKIDVHSYIEELKQEEYSGIKDANPLAGGVEQGDGQRNQMVEIDFEKSAQPTVTQKKADVPPAVQAPVKSAIPPKINESIAVPLPPQIKKGGTHPGIKRIEKTTVYHRTDASRKIKTKKDSSSKGLALALIAGALGFFILKPKLQHLWQNEKSPDAERSISSLEKKIVPQELAQKNSPKFGKLRFVNAQVEMDLILDGEKVSDFYPGKVLEIPVGKSIKVQLSKKGHRPFVTEVELNENILDTQIDIPELQLARMGQLTTSMNYEGSVLKFNLEDQVVQYNLPFKNREIPVGDYEGKIINPLLGTSKPVKFIIEESKESFLE